MDILLQDTRLALRQLRRTPVFTFTVLATLTLGVGATTAVFSLVNGVLLNPLGFPTPDRLVYVSGVNPQGGKESISPQDLLDFQAQAHSFAALAAVDGGRSMNLTRPSASALRINAARVGASFFDILGLPAQHGQFFQRGADATDAPKVVVMSDAMWRRDYGADPRLVGQTITLDDAPYQVVGIAPPKFDFPANPDVWYPSVWRDFEKGDTARGFHSVHVIGRLKDGATLAGANRDLAAIAARIAGAWPRYDAGVSAKAIPLRDEIVGDVERPLWILFGAVAFVLLIACANIGNLMLVRATARESEVAVRTALGASRGRLARQFITDGVLLGGVGAGFGALAASWAVEAVVRLGPASLPRLSDVAVDGPVLAFAALISLSMGAAFGLLPALHLARGNVSNMLRAGARGLTSSAQRTRALLVVSELALGTVLLVGAGLLARSFERLISVDPGFRADHVVVFDVALSGKQYEYDAGTNAFADALLDRLQALPGTVGTGVAANRPFDTDPGFSASTGFWIDGRPKPAPGREPESRLLPVSPSYFATMGMTLVRGRAFTDAENRLDAAPAIVINQALADKYFPGQNPIGQHLTFGIRHTVSAAPNDTVRAQGEIVGVVRTVQHASLDAKPEPATYFPFHTAPFGPSFVVRTNGDVPTVEREIRAQVAAVDRNVPIYGMETLPEAVSASVAQPRFYMIVCGAFAAIALLLAAVGIYGVVSFAVGQRQREFGLRLALGATPGDVVRLVISSGARLAVAGLVLGLVGAFIATRAMQGLVFGVSALDPIAFAAAVLMLGGAAVLASWLPGRRAAGIDPVVAMRAE